MSPFSILLAAPVLSVSALDGGMCEQSRTNLDCKDEDLEGGTHSNVGDAATCCALCDADSRCKAWTVYPKQGQCYLKSGCSNPIANDGTSGGSAVPLAACSHQVHSSTDCAGEDLEGGTHTNVSDAETCCARCDADSRCKAWTVYPSRNVCYLKSGCSNLITNDGTSGLPHAPAPTPPAPPSQQVTTVTIDGDKWRVNGQLTFKGSMAEGSLTNSRMINGIFDDSNPSSHERWAYPDTGKWDPERNTREFVGNMSSWKDAGLNSFTLGLQGGSPDCYGGKDWVASAFDSEGRLDPAWMARLSLVLKEADSLGMVPIIQLFYYRFYPIVGDSHREKAVTAAAEWIAKAGYKNVIIDVFNEKCDEDWAPLIDLVHEVSERQGNRLLAGTSCSGCQKPSEEVVKASDFVLVHGNGAGQSSQVKNLINDVRGMSSFKAKGKIPIVFNEDDHGGFAEGDDSNFKAALEQGTSWGFLCCCDDSVQGDYSTGYQCPPIDWRMSGEGNCLSGPNGDDMKHGSKREFAQMLQKVTQASVTV